MMTNQAEVAKALLPEEAVGGAGLAKAATGNVSAVVGRGGAHGHLARYRRRCETTLKWSVWLVVDLDLLAGCDWPPSEYQLGFAASQQPLGLCWHKQFRAIGAQMAIGRSCAAT
jgi:hypothetical protein